MYKLEMHVHTSPTSRCASAKAEDAVAQYTQAGRTTWRGWYPACRL